MEGVFQFVGCITCGCMVIGISYILIQCIIEGIKYLLLQHKIRHRFDNSPIAKCYCIDCKHYTTYGHCLLLNNKSVPDSGFCWQAEPITKSNLRKD